MNEFWKYTVILLLVEAAVFIASASIGVLPLSFLLEQYSQLEQNVSKSAIYNFLLIYTNNFRIDLLSSIPIIGPPSLMFVIFTTGQVVYAVALNVFHFQSSLAGPLTALFLLLMPHGVVEFLSYAMASSVSIRAVQLYRRGFDVDLIIKYFFTFLALSLVNLAVAAALEATELSLAGEGIIYAYALWLVAGPYLVLLYFAQKKVELRLLAGHIEGSDRFPQGSAHQPS